MAYPMGELKRGGGLRVDFDHRLKLEFHGSRITSDAGLPAYRELDDVLGLTDLGGATLSDLRRGKNTRHLLTGLLRQSVFGRLAGFAGACPLCYHCPRLRGAIWGIPVNPPDSGRQAMNFYLMRAIVERKGLDRRAAPASRMGRFETEWPATQENLAALINLSGDWIDRVHDRKTPKMIILDMGSSERTGVCCAGRSVPSQ